ncbi:MAG: hypothetical protein HC877_04075 [Thioploca sp.]|nr:hypothetical protein [Thioploca sp.]
MQHHFLWLWWFVLVVVTQNATAITYSVPDQHRHPSVGALVGPPNKTEGVSGRLLFSCRPLSLTKTCAFTS